MKLKKLIKVSVLFLSIFLALTFSACSIDDFIASTDEAKSIEKTYINEDGELIIEYSDKTSQNLGLVVGKDGVDGKTAPMVKMARMVKTHHSILLNRSLMLLLRKKSLLIITRVFA